MANGFFSYPRLSAQIRGKIFAFPITAMTRDYVATGVPGKPYFGLLGQDSGDLGDFLPLLSLYDFPPPWRHPVGKKI
jgi:hypothetical protein